MTTRRTREAAFVVVTAFAMLLAVAPVAANDPITAKATGGGVYQLGALPVSFHFAAIQFDDGRAAGTFQHSVLFQGQLVQFTGEVTCVTADPVKHRAWIGGVITANDSAHPSFLQPRNQVGRDIWFRVVDYGEGPDVPADRTTFVGFEGDAQILTSAAYCAGKPWPEPPPDDRTWPLSEGNIQVHR